MSNSTRWPRSSDVIRSNIDADSYLFTVHLQSRSAHPYPLKPFTRAVAALNLQPKVQEIVKALNASVKQTIEERAAIRSTTSHQLKTRSSSPLQTTFYPISPIQTSNSGVTLTSTVKSFGVEELLTHHSSSSTSSFLTHHSSSSTSSFSLSPLTIIKLQGKRHESKAWTSSYSPSKLTLEALRYHTNSSLTLGKSHTVFIPQQAPEPPLILQSITLEKKQQEKLKQIISPTTLSSSIPTVLSHRSLTDTRDMITGHDNVHENKEGEGYVAIADSPRSLVSNVVNIVKPIVLTPLLSALRISTIKNGKKRVDSSAVSEILSPSNSISPPKLPMHSHSRKHLYENRALSIPYFKNVETQPEQPCNDLRSELHLRFEPGSRADRKIFSAAHRIAAAEKRLCSDQIALSISPKAFQPQFEQDRVIAQAFALQHAQLESIQTAGVKSVFRDARSLSHLSIKKQGSAFLKEVGGIDGHIQHRRHVSQPLFEEVIAISSKKRTAIYTNNSKGVSECFVSLQSQGVVI
jgi:hypothetical protein